MCLLMGTLGLLGQLGVLRWPGTVQWRAVLFRLACAGFFSREKMVCLTFDTGGGRFDTGGGRMVWW